MKFAEEINISPINLPIDLFNSSQMADAAQDSALKVCITLRLQPELFWFQGHFTDYPLLPGVAQVNWAMHYAKKILHVTAVFKSMEVVKFQMPLFPNEIVELTLNWQPELEKLSFQYHAKGKLASSGKISLGQE